MLAPVSHSLSQACVFSFCLICLSLSFPLSIIAHFPFFLSFLWFSLLKLAGILQVIYCSLPPPARLSQRVRSSKSRSTAGRSECVGTTGPRGGGVMRRSISRNSEDLAQQICILKRHYIHTYI